MRTQPAKPAKRKRIKHLTPEQKKAVWAKPEANAGAGWHSDPAENRGRRDELDDYEAFRRRAGL